MYPRSSAVDMVFLFDYILYCKPSQSTFRPLGNIYIENNLDRYFDRLFVQENYNYLEIRICCSHIIILLYNSMGGRMGLENSRENLFGTIT